MHSTIQRAVLAVLVSLPFAYFGMLLAVAVHEFIGHGLVSLMVGGGFTGVMLDFDGMGWAHVPMDDVSNSQRALVLIGGPASTMMVGLITLGLAWALRRRPHIALPCVLIAANHVLEGSSYAFWNAIHGGPDGDIGAVMEMYSASQWPSLIVSGAIMLGSIYVVTVMLVWLAESYVFAGKSLSQRMLITTVGIISLTCGAAWFLFDWDQLLPRLGHWPNIIALFLHVLAGASLFVVRPQAERISSPTRLMLRSALMGCCLVIVSAAVIGVWLRHGLLWS